jgi:acetyl-CoA C-acetyltransferase
MERNTDPVVVVSAARTPMGGFQGSLSSLTAPALGAVALRGALGRAGWQPDDASAAQGEVLMGCVLPAGLGQAPARQAALEAGLPEGTPCTGVSKVCGSGMKAVMLAHDQLLAGSMGWALAGGMESMSNAPYLLPKARSGQRLGHGQMLDHMFLDGLEDAYGSQTRGRLMGTFADECARHHGFSRAQQDDYAVASTVRAQQAIREGRFDWEVAPVSVAGRGGPIEVTHDEQPLKAQLERIPTLKPAFAPDGTVTAANASSISDGAAALLLMRRSQAEVRGLAPLAVIHGHATHAQAPAWFAMAPVGAMRRLLDRVGWTTADVDLWEINEAFAVVALAAMKALSLPHERVNVHGGACALGHPIGASGARILVTLLGALRHHGLRRGVASLCIGGGEATAVAVERCD